MDDAPTEDVPRIPPDGPVDDDLYAYYSEIPTFLRLPLNRSGTNAEICILGIPFDLGVTERAGAREGPRSVRVGSTLSRQSHGVLGSPYAKLRCVDAGDVAIDHLNEAASRDAIEARYRSLARNARVIAIGGDHSVTLNCLAALASPTPLSLIHFDAHSDTCDEDAGSRVNHATVFRRAAERGFIDPKKSVQIGLRPDLHGNADLAWARDQGFTIFTSDDFVDGPSTPIVERTRAIVNGSPVYLSVDIDVLDPAFAPGTGTPEPGGLSVRELRYILIRLAGLEIVGADLVEVAPAYDVGNLTSLVAGRLLFDLVCLVASNRSPVDSAPRS